MAGLSQIENAFYLVALRQVDQNPFSIGAGSAKTLTKGSGRQEQGLGRFDRYILSHLIRVFGFFALVLVGIYWVNRAVILLDRYLSEGQSGGMVLELTVLSIPAIMTIVLPVAGFVAAAYTTNRLHADSELVVVQATGYSAFRLARPFAVFGMLLAGLMLALGHLVVPLSFQQMSRIEAELAEAISARLLVPGTFQSPTDGVTVYVRDIASDGTLEGLLVTDRREGIRETTYSAHRALLVRHDEGPRLVMFDGMAQTIDTRTGRLATTVYDSFTVSIGTLVSAPAQRRLDYRALPTLSLLSPTPEILERSGRSVDYLFREAHLRVTEALLSVGAVLVGFSALMLGGFSRFGLWRQILLAVLLVVVVKLTDNAAIDVAREDPANWPAVYLSSAFALLLNLLLLWLGNGSFGAWIHRRQAA
jgi:lipopolysaccharide export system permease protein